MRVKVSGIKEIRKGVRRLQRGIRTKLLVNVGKEQIKRIKQRAAKGKGYRGPFKRYTPKYAAAKGKTTPDLRVTGKLMNSFDFKVKNANLTLSNDAAYAAFVDAERPFLGFSTTDEEKILNQISKNLNKQIRKGGFL